MRLVLNLKSANGRTFFVSHDNLQQDLIGMVYKVFEYADPDYSRWLHHEGWISPGGRKLKLFTYSRLFSRARVVNTEGIFFGDHEVNLYLSSPDSKVISMFSAGAMATGILSLGNIKLQVVSLKRLEEPHTPVLKVTTLSPFVISDSATNPESKHKYLRLDLEENWVLERLVQNALLKWTTYGRRPEDFALKIKPLGFYRDKYIYFQPADFSYPSNEATLQLEGPPEVVNFVYSCGLGEKTGMGFGCLGIAK